MKIGIDGILLTFKKKNSGIGRYTLSLLDEFCKDTSKEYYVFVDRLYKYISVKERYLTNANVKVILIPLPTFLKALYKLWLFFLWPFFMKMYRIDIAFAPSGFLPSWGYKKGLVTIHDLAFYRFPETVNRKSLRMFKKYYPLSIKRADIVFTVSNYSKSVIIERFPEYSEKVVAIYNGVSESFFENLSKAEEERCREKYACYDDFLFYYGTIEPRKNIVSSLRAFEIVKKSFPKLKFLLAGANGWKNEELRKFLEETSIKDDIVFLGPIEDSEIKYLLDNTKCFVYVPLLEGFGLPVLEAMARGCNVVTSNVTSLPEVIGTTGEVASPDDIEAIATCVINCSEADNSTPKIKRAKEFSWKSASDKYLMYFN